MRPLRLRERPPHSPTMVTAMKTLMTVAFTSILLLISDPALAQGRFSVEISGDGAYATQDLGGTDLRPGLGFEAALAYRFLPHASAYAGWGWHHFATDEPFAGADVDVEETGYVFGLRFGQGVAATPLRYFVQAGGIYNHLEFEDGDDIIADSGHGLGWEVGGGLMLPFSSRWHLMPGVHYRSLAREVGMDGADVDVDLAYFTVRVGIARTF